MNKKLGLAVAGALVAFASTANAGITIPAGDWTVDIGGNVNAYYNHTSGSAVANSKNVVNTGLLPSALGIGAKTRQNDLDVAFQFTFFTGIDSTTPGTAPAGYGNNAALGLNSLNIRQAFMTIGDASWGQIKLGRDLGVFESDAILSDMTLLGVGSGAAGTGNTTLGRIGFGYQYADWKSQIQYSTPNWNGFQVTAALDTPWQNGDTGYTNDNKDMGFEGKATYDFAANDVTGRVWVGGISQKVNANVGTTATHAYSYTADGYDLGAKVGYAGAELVGSYYSGDGLGRTGFLLGGNIAGTGTKNKSDGYYVQGTYKLPGIGTKLGASYGESNIDVANNGGENQQSSWIVGAYHPLTKSVNLVAEYTYSMYEVKGGTAPKAETNAKTVSLGAIMFF
jgi:predicted porin